MPKIHIDEVYPKNSLYPMIVTFQNGYTTDEFSSNSCTLLKDHKGAKTIATEIAGVVYSGTELVEDLGRSLILTRNKINGKVRLIEVGTAELRPNLSGQDGEANIELDTSYLELSRKFGSKKHKQRVEQRERLKVNVTTVTEQMHNVTVNVTEEQVDLSSYIKTNTDDFYIPPINRKADKPEDVYDIHEILSENQYEKIYSEIKNKEYTKELQPWIKEMVTKKKLSDEMVVLAVYTDSLLKLSAILMKEIVKKNFVVCGVSPTLNDIILKTFTTNVNGKRSRPVQYKDKAFCHALVFLMLINNLKCDIEDLSKNVKFSARTLITKFKVVGATIVTSGSQKIAQLKLPLSSVSSGRRKSAKF